MLPWIAVDPFRHQYPDHDSEHTPSSGHKVDAQPVEYPFQRTMSAQEEEEKEEEMQEATPIELFYDLFFVANLTTVTGVHYITENQSKIVPSLFFFFSFFPNIILLRFGILRVVFHYPMVHMAARHTLGRALFRGLGVRAHLQVDSFRRYGRLLLRLDHMESSRPDR